LRVIHKFGIVDFEGKVTTNGKRNKDYSLWASILQRCYGDNTSARKGVYLGCSVSENFKSYSYFSSWCNNQIGYTSKDSNGSVWHLDKDLLLKGNKIYSEDNCVFIPQQINALITKRESLRGEYPIGTSLNKRSGKFQANCKDGAGKLIYLGLHDTPEQAFQAYKTFKEALIKEVAEKWKGDIDPRAYQALLSYRVEITD